MRRRMWVLFGATVSGLLMGWALSLPHLASHTAQMLLLLSACIGQLVVSSCGGMMGALRTERGKRVSGSFYQAGSMGFGALSVSLLIWLYQHHPHAVAPVAAAVIILPGFFALIAPDAPLEKHDSYRETMQRLWTECKATFFRWQAVPYALVMVLPQSTGSAVSLLPGVAQDYGVSGDQVAWINGIGGTLLMAAGSMAAALLPVRARASVTYLTVGLVNAATLCMLWLGPLRPLTYFAGVGLYLFTVGAAYALFTAVVLEFLGASGKSGSGRYSIINSLGNIPVLLMIRLDGVGASRLGPRWLAGTEAVAAIVTCVALLSYFLTRKGGETATEKQASIAG